MPNIKQGGGYSLTFSKKNKDIKTQLDTLKRNGVTITDYICEAIRFFEKNKNNDFEKSQINSKDIEIIIEKKVKQMLSEYNGNVDLQIKQQRLLEDNLDYINDEDLEED